MLNPELAEERLKEFAVPDLEARRLQRAGKLQHWLRPVAYGLLHCDGRGNRLTDYKQIAAVYSEAASQLDSLQAPDRTLVFRVMFGPIAPQVEAGWQFFLRLPYQPGWNRRAFRAPHSPRTGKQVRQDWILSLSISLARFEQDLEWLAAWAPYISEWGADGLGILFAAAIDAGGKEGEAVFEILCASARGEHPVGAMGRHVSRALLAASRPEGWALMERMLIAAQRQEGLRQVILETIDEAHPDAYRRMLRLILDRDLLRFSAAVRAADTWFGAGWSTADIGAIRRALEMVLRFLEQPRAREDAIHGPDPEALYFALWAGAFEDAIAAGKTAAALLDDEIPERRFAAAHFLSQLGLISSKKSLLPALSDPDLHVAVSAMQAFLVGAHEKIVDMDLFERLEQLIPRLPAKDVDLKPVIWPWLTLRAARSAAAGMLLRYLGKRPPQRLLPYLSMMEVDDRIQVAKKLSELPAKEDGAIRQSLFALVGDPAAPVREEALNGLARATVTEEEAVSLERLLTRKSGDLRRGIIKLLLNGDDSAALASADRLVASSIEAQRSAGLETLRELVDSGRAVDACRERARKWRADRPALDEAEETLLRTLLAEEREAPTLENALGLLDPALQTKPVPPRKITGRKMVTEPPLACLNSLDDLIHKHREEPLESKLGDGAQIELLGNAEWRFARPNPRVPLEEDLPRLPFRELWDEWWAVRGRDLRDPDGLELIRALQPFHAPQRYRPGVGSMILPAGRSDTFMDLTRATLRYRNVTHQVLNWLVRIHPPSGAVDFLLDAIETTFASYTAVQERAAAPAFSLAALSQKLMGFVTGGARDSLGDARAVEPGWQTSEWALSWLELAREFREFRPDEWQPAQHARLWRLLRWLEAGASSGTREAELDEILAAHRSGAATEMDLIEHLLGPRKANDSGWSSLRNFGQLGQLTGRKIHPLMVEFAVLRDIVALCRERILEVELERGDLPTAASSPALALRYIEGMETLFRLIGALGKTSFVRGYVYGLDKAAVFSRLIRSTFPGEGDTPELFAPRFAVKISERRLIELGVYAPQWAGHVESALGWPGFAEAVWWVHAHTKDSQWSVDAEIRETWTAQVSDRTPLSAQSLLDGAVDVAWFHRAFKAMGQDRWAKLDMAAKYASGGGGHKRAQLFADAIHGNISRQDLMERIRVRRNQDAVRALGLLPLEPGREDVLERYKLIQEFARTSNQFGSMRQASEKLAASIALQNLARTAGYPDPARLEWAMEAEAVADLAAGPVRVQSGGVEVTLSLNAMGAPGLGASRAGKLIKTIPPAVKKDPAVAQLQSRKKEIERQASRMRHSLEEAMCRGDRFTGRELITLCAHPVLAPMLRSLALMSESAAGYPVDGGAALETLEGKLVSLEPDSAFRIAHPHDLLLTGEWDRWQRDCFNHERVQPFKQVFRELYVLTDAEKTEGISSSRYAGHQVNPRQALALFGARGWISHPEEGIRRTFHSEGVAAWITFQEGFFTPTEVEGLTLEAAAFSRPGEWTPLALSTIPPRVFSEAMRDLDLVVSVAHQGGVDPEATASTTEMREALIRESCRLLKIENVRLKAPHALVDGRLGTYSIHLGSGVVHRQPGGSICLAPVHSQHRGRLFLPFADDDPRTAEVLSKVVLLSRDHEIKDPTILEQVLGVGS